jgi:hypothetical protein
MAATAADASDIVVDDDDGNLRWFYPAPDAGYGFCRRCGSSLFWQSEDTQHTSICAGALDPPTGLSTAQAWWVSEASDYHTRPPVPEYQTE